MKDFKITRRVFVGAAMYMVSAPLFATRKNTVLDIQHVIKDGQFFSAQELTILIDIAEIMIPRTDTPGATDVFVIPVLDGLMLTWASNETKVQFRACIEQVKSLARDTYLAEYSSLGLTKRQHLVEQIDHSSFNNKKTKLSRNYRPLKEMIFHIYYNSEQANPDFVLIPGSYRGDLSKQELEAIKARGYL